MLTKIHSEQFDILNEQNMFLHLDYMCVSSVIYSVLWNVLLSVWEITLDAI